MIMTVLSCLKVYETWSWSLGFLEQYTNSVPYSALLLQAGLLTPHVHACEYFRVGCSILSPSTNFSPNKEIYNMEGQIQN